jgi:tetratricopeptide (TPR) repeat protein
VKSSDRPSRLLRRLVPWAVAAAAALTIGRVRPALAERFHELRVTSDTYALPPSDQIVAASLGYRAALADLIYGHVLVSYGLHFQEKRRFEFVGEYLDAINALDPRFRDPYRFADTLLVLAPVAPRLQEYQKARAILERGLRELPYDTELWLTAGQYMSYLAPPFLEDPAMKKEWRARGAQVLARACELASNNENVPYHCITAAKMLKNAGAREAAIESLQRMIAVSDDPEIEKLALAYLEKHLGEREREIAEGRKRAFEKAWKADQPFVSKDAMLLLGPRVDTAACAGVGKAGTEGCETSWVAWAEAIDRREGVAPR